MKYKHSRQELRTWFHINIGFDSIAEKHFQKMLLAQKEDKKEWKPCDCPKGGIDGDGMVCDKCGGTEWVKVKSTPSPLEGFEEIEEIKFPPFDPPQDDNVSWVIKKVEEKVNLLIRNQKKLYQLIKDKL